MDESTDGDVRARLASLVDDVKPSPDLSDRVTAGLARHRRASRARVLLAAAVVLVVGAAGVVALAGLADPDQADDDVVASGPTTAADGDALPPAPIDVGQATGSDWAEVAPAPLQGREAAAWGAGGRYLVVWGGSVDLSGEVLRDGAVLDGATGRWRTLGPFPDIPGRTGATLVISGATAYLVGGGTGVGGTEPTSDVVAFDLEAATAEVIASSELAARVSPIVALHDGRLVVAGGLAEPPGGVADLRTATLDLGTGEWEEGPDLPWGVAADPFLAGSLRGSAAAVGDDAIVIAQSSGGDPEASVSLAEVDLTTLDARAQVPIALEATAIALDEGRLLVRGAQVVIVVERGPVEAVSVDLATGEVRWQTQLAVPACEADVEIQPVADSALVVQDPCSETSVFVDAATGQTATLRPVDPPGVDVGFGRLISVGEALLIVELERPGEDPNQGSARPARTVALAAGPSVPRPDPRCQPSNADYFRSSGDGTVERFVTDADLVIRGRVVDVEQRLDPDPGFDDRSDRIVATVEVTETFAGDPKGDTVDVFVASAVSNPQTDDPARIEGGDDHTYAVGDDLILSLGPDRGTVERTLKGPWGFFVITDGQLDPDQADHRRRCPVVSPPPPIFAQAERLGLEGLEAALRDAARGGG